MSETQQIPPGNEPFTTTDAELALTLLSAGCQFAAPQDGGPAQMHYTPEICRNRWVTRRNEFGPYRMPLLSHAPQSLEEFERAVMRAVDMKIPGVVTYYILRDDNFREAIAMHDKLAKEAADAAREEREMNLPKIDTLSETAAVVLICYIRRTNEKKMEGYGWVRVPNLAVGDVRKTVNERQGAPREVMEQVSYSVSGTGKIWSLNLSDELRARIMPDGKPFLHPKPKP